MKEPLPDHVKNLVHNYIIRSNLIDVLESDLNMISKTNFKLYEPHTNLVEETLQR